MDGQTSTRAASYETAIVDSSRFSPPRLNRLRRANPIEIGEYDEHKQNNKEHEGSEFEFSE